MSSWLRKTIKKALKSKKAAKKVANYLADKDVFNRYLMQTSQAVDIVSGGIKINALPEKVYAVINHRIAVESHVSAVRNNIQSLIGSQILPEFPMSLNAWGDISGNTSTSSLGQITLSNFDEPLNPSPTSPYDTDAYKMLSGTIKQVFGEDIVVAPSVMTGNTDTKFYWDLSRNIYRFTPSRIEGRESVHTVDEKLGMKEHIEAVKFYTQMMLNANRS
jgi:Gly-Xaa carboxypeptidase